MNWSSWAEATFGTEFEIWHDGLAVERFDHLSSDDRDLVISLLPEGIERRDHVAAVGARKLGAAAMLPHLETAVPGTTGRFLVEATRAIVDLGGDATAPIDRMLSMLRREPLWVFRKDIAIGLRHIPGAGTVDALLQAVRHDPDYLVRYHAAESLLHIAGVDPPDLSKHSRLFSHIAADDPERHSTAADLLGRRFDSTGQTPDDGQ